MKIKYFLVDISCLHFITGILDCALISHEVIVNLIAATTTQKGLRIECGMDKKVYPKGVKISDNELNEINLTIEKFHGEWNYTIKPNEKR